MIYNFNILTVLEDTTFPVINVKKLLFKLINVSTDLLQCLVNVFLFLHEIFELFECSPQELTYVSLHKLSNYHLACFVPD